MLPLMLSSRVDRLIHCNGGTLVSLRSVLASSRQWRRRRRKEDPQPEQAINEAPSDAEEEFEDDASFNEEDGAFFSKFLQQVEEDMAPHQGPGMTKSKQTAGKGAYRTGFAKQRRSV